ncbi:putative RNA-binding protein eif1ad [Coemansia interrupta]|uniref:RNA-binding protein eif1ad n=1 Tax=Coemansia interrupta TaxID=1126814 RepID=A0A9W8HGI2_9FUNG|nr:putative RNA-binding protein eif1ad [Coemansia interrupta]
MGRGKYTEQEALDALPEPTNQCPVVRALGPRGQNLHEVVVARSLVTPEISQRLGGSNGSGSDKAWFTTLVQMPPKFRNVVWVKRGSYVLADLSEQFTEKIGGEVAMVLMASQVKHLKQTGQWPSEYETMWDDVIGADSGGNPNRQYIGEDDEDESDED